MIAAAAAPRPPSTPLNIVASHALLTMDGGMPDPCRAGPFRALTGGDKSPWKCYIRSMSLRPFASGMVSFGLVTIPVKLYSTGETAVGIQLNMLHRKCGSRLKQQYVCPVDDVVVGRDEMVKGYEYAKGQYVLFTEDEIKALSREATNAMEITEFVPLEQVDPIYFERSYYLGPTKAASGPNRFVAEAMKQTS